MRDYRQKIEEQKEVYEDFQAAHRDAKRRGASKSSVYNTSLLTQIGHIMRRQTLIKWQDKFSLYVSWATMLFVAVILGTVWLELPQTSEGAFTRGGLLFISLLFNAFKAFGELGSIVMGRPLVSKHTAFTFYRPSALWLAQIFVDGLFAAAKIVVFSIMWALSSPSLVQGHSDILQGIFHVRSRSRCWRFLYLHLGHCHGVSSNDRVFQVCTFINHKNRCPAHIVAEQSGVCVPILISPSAVPS